MKNTQEKLIVALDVPEISEALKLVNTLSDEVIYYKIGLELMMSGRYFELIEALKKRGKKVFCDLKFHDIPTTVARAVENLAKHEVDLLTIHAASSDIAFAAAAKKGKMKIVGVTVLTTYDKELFDRTNDITGFSRGNTIENAAFGRAKIALENGLDGVVASAFEAAKLRQELGKKFGEFFIVTPGIRLAEDKKKIKNDDQKRAADVEFAIKSGSSHLVVGRPITRDENPQKMAQKFNQLIKQFS